MNRAIRLPDESFTYGKALRPSTPIRDVVANFYGDVAEADMLNRYDFIRTQSRSGPRLVSHERHTKASALARDAVKSRQGEEGSIIMNAKSLFKMRKFLNVAPRINTNMEKR